MEAVGRLAGGVAHDFNNLLMVIQGHAELLRDRARECGRRRSEPFRLSGRRWYLRKVEQIQKAAERAAGFTRQLLAFSRMQVLQSKVIALNESSRRWARCFRALSARISSLEIVPSPDLGRVKADPSQMEQVILNLAVNARDAMPKGGRLSIETANVEIDEPLRGVTRRWRRAPTFCSRFPTLAWAWIRKRRRTSSSRFSLPRKSARAPAWAWRPYTAW